MTKILGIDTGTNSLGWAIVERTAEGNKLFDHGVHIFQEGVGNENGKEKSKASVRTKYKHQRIGYYRTRLRKIRLLRVLSDNHLCPPISSDELREWRLHKVYPQNPLFMQWQKTDDKSDVNPYHYRHLCLTTQLDLTDLSQRYLLGRALYHLCQRRGFLSNRKEQNDDESGKVKEGISILSKEMSEQGFEYLGDYFYHLYTRGEKIRNRYTSRNEHYLHEFHAICRMQGLEDDLVKKIEKIIFNPGSPKSQKGQVGKCVFEPRKSKCPLSHPLFEEYRMLSFINNIRIQTPSDDEMRPLNANERKLAEGLFYRKSKPISKFEDIAKKIAGKGKYGFYKKDRHMPYLFNYPMNTSVTGSPVTAQLIDVFGPDWKSSICEVYTGSVSKRPKTELEMLNDVWHALFSFDNEEKLKEFAQKHLQLQDEEAIKFSNIKVPKGYASLSLKAICRILPYLRRGLIYSHAAFLGNLADVIPAYEWSIKEMREAAIERVIDLINEFEPQSNAPTLEACIKGYLKERYHLDQKTVNKLYHPSMMEAYPRQRPNDHGIYQLGSPRLNSVRNPMAMRALFRLRKVVNRLLAEGKIDPETTINIEFARELNDANKRAAIRNYQQSRQRERQQAHDKIIELYREKCGQTIEPTETDILKYLLWEEQDKKCLYTGKNICLCAFIGPDPLYDIEHTIPQSVGGDSTRMNLTLCEKRFNREEKKTKLPSQLSNHAEILERIAPWKDRYEALDKQIERLKKGFGETKEAKDQRIQRRHYLTLERDYWKGKYERFTMTEVPEGFSRRQGVDIGIISRYARLYLMSVFSKVFIVKGIATSDFRQIWGLQEVYSRKERVSHIQHCVDAIVVACIGRAEYNDLARYYHQHECYRWYGKSKPTFSLPWPQFVEDVKKLEDEVLVSHHTPDNMSKQGRRRIKIGRSKMLARGDAARGSLHEDTCYGAITTPGTGELKYVVRKSLATLKESDVKNIVDDIVRSKVEQAIREKGFSKAMAEPIWMNPEKQIPIRKVRCYATVNNPLHIRKQRDVSVKEYKRQFHVKNDSNYLMAVYHGRDARGRECRKFEMITNLQAAEFYKTSNDKVAVNGCLVPTESPQGFPLAYTLKIGTMVLVYKNSPEEVWEADNKERGKHLYKVTSLWKDGRVEMVSHKEARPSTELSSQTASSYDPSSPSPKLRIKISKGNFLVEGYDFAINELGEIKWLRYHD